MVKQLVFILILFIVPTLGDFHSGSTSLRAAVKAAQYLLRQRNSEYHWDDLTPRALVALSFLDKHLSIPKLQKERMVNQLKQKLHQILENDLDEVSLHTLTAYSNALYAVCEDPRHIKISEDDEIDLIELVRLKVETAMKSGLHSPIGFLTLCVAKDVTSEHLEYLISVYDDKRNDRIDVKALTLISMASCKLLARRYDYDEMEKRAQDFIQRFKSQNTSILSKTMIIQVLNSFGYNSMPLQAELLKFQTEEDSFDGLLATMSAIPALLNQSLADLQCKSRTYEVRSRASSTSLQLFSPEHRIEFSVIIPEGENVGKHTLTLHYVGRKSLYELMKTAQKESRLYRFTVDEIEGLGKRVNAIAGISNDVESGRTWTLYKKSTDSRNSADIKEPGDIDWIFPADQDSYTFQLEYEM